MNRHFPGRNAILISIQFFLAANLMAQTNQSFTVRWLENAPVTPQFKIPKSKTACGKSAPKSASSSGNCSANFRRDRNSQKSKRCRAKDRGDFIVERFQFDNGAGAIVPVICCCQKMLRAHRVEMK